MADEYQQWLQQYGLREDPTYDLHAAFAAGLKPDERGHLPDDYKSPAHPTFSDESVLSGKDGKQGGRWEESKTSPGKWVFKASPWNLENTPAAKLRAYFDKVEPGNTVEFPDGTRYVGGSSMADQPKRRGEATGQMSGALSQQQLAMIDAMLRKSGYAVTVGTPRVETPQQPQYNVQVGQPQIEPQVEGLDLSNLYAGGR